MRVLLLHNRYREQGGEERAVSEIAALLRGRGHTVEVMERSSGEAGPVRATSGLLAGGHDPQAVARAVACARAEVVHAHNVHPLFGWRALAAARSAGARTVLHLHNFRLYCAIGVAYRDGHPCFDCNHRNMLPGLLHRCRGSPGEAAVYALALHVQQPRLVHHADRIVTVSHATAAQLRQLGLAGEPIDVLPNFVPAASLSEDSSADKGEHALISGRLVEEKGFDTAIGAARMTGVPLVVAGSGPDEARLRSLASGADVRFTGHLPEPELDSVRRQAAVVLVPSRSDEACPYAALDAMAAGVPLLASDRGGLPELVDGSASLRAEDQQAWSQALRELWADPGRRLQEGRRVLARAREQLSEDAYHRRLIELYEG